MRIVSVGRGNVGGGLARLWTRAGHEVTALGQDGGDASHADVVVIAVPGSAIEDALSRVTGIDGKTTIDTSNSFSGPAPGFASLVAQVRSIVGGPAAKCFNTNFALLYDEVAKQRVAPTSVFAADPEARPVAERLISDAGFEPLHVGGLDRAPMLEAQIGFTMMLAQGELGPYFYRFAKPGDL